MPTAVVGAVVPKSPDHLILVLVSQTFVLSLHAQQQTPSKYVAVSMPSSAFEVEHLLVGSALSQSGAMSDVHIASLSGIICSNILTRCILVPIRQSHFALWLQKAFHALFNLC